jgi:hypothetical protein
MVDFLMLKQHRSQASMEFLMTYGWALLVVVVVIIALSYFGLLNPNKYLPDKAELGQGLNVLDSTVSINQIKILVQNGLGKQIANLQINATVCNNSLGSISSRVTLSESQTQLITISCANTSKAGSKFTSKLLINYTTQLSPPYMTSHSATGIVRSTVLGVSTLLVNGGNCTQNGDCFSNNCTVMTTPNSPLLCRGNVGIGLPCYGMYGYDCASGFCDHRNSATDGLCNFGQGGNLCRYDWDCYDPGGAICSGGFCAVT